MCTDEDTVIRYLEERNFCVQRFAKPELRAGKTPDFRVSRDGLFLFYCEVKSILKDQWLDNQLAEAVPGAIAGGARQDPVFNRLTGDIHGASQQLLAVNKDINHPNVLVFVNHDDMCGFNDLLSVLTGNFYAGDGTAHPIYQQFSHGRIRDEKANIHMFIWLDDYNPERLLFSQTNETHHNTLCSAFEIDQGNIRQI